MDLSPINTSPSKINSNDDLIYNPGVPSSEPVETVVTNASPQLTTKEAVDKLMVAQKGETAGATSWCQTVKQYVSKIGDFFKNAFSKLGQAIANAWDKVKDFFSRKVAVAAAPAATSVASPTPSATPTSPKSPVVEPLAEQESDVSEAVDGYVNRETHDSLTFEVRNPGLETQVLKLSKEELDELDELEKRLQDTTGTSIEDQLSAMSIDFNVDSGDGDIMGSSQLTGSDADSPFPSSLTPTPLDRTSTEVEASTHGLQIVVTDEDGVDAVDTATQRLPDASPSTQSDTRKAA